MIQVKKFIFLVGFAALLVSCSHNPLKIDVSGVKVDLTIKHLDADLLKGNGVDLQKEVPELEKSYGDFFKLFTYQMIGIGGPDQSDFYDMLNKFVADTLIQDLRKRVPEDIDTVEMRDELTDAFKHYKYYFPEKEIPNIFTCISGFNQSVVTSTDLIGVSLDKYLGAGNEYYRRLGLPGYKRRNMTPQRMVPEMMYAWGVTEWPIPDKADNLLSEMIYNGEIMYFMDAMFPGLNDTLKIGFTKRQLDFCQASEAEMWTYLAGQKLLFTTNRMHIKRFIDDSPYTASFGEKSPGRTGIWLGWQIVRSYMKTHPDAKLPDLLKNQDYQAILNQSGYQP